MSPAQQRAAACSLWLSLCATSATQGADMPAPAGTAAAPKKEGPARRNKRGKRGLAKTKMFARVALEPRSGWLPWSVETRRRPEIAGPMFERIVPGRLPVARGSVNDSVLCALCQRHPERESDTRRSCPDDRRISPQSRRRNLVSMTYIFDGMQSETIAASNCNTRSWKPGGSLASES
jgi:hypothetical protein